MEYFELNNGLRMPAMGLGTFPMNRLTLLKTIRKATKVGFNSFDTSNAYGNERYVGYGVKFTSLSRENVFITTKLSNTQQRVGNIRKAVETSLRLLNVDYIDLYLMHWPNPDTYLSSWTQMEKMYEEGLFKAIGVCNFHQHHLNNLLKVANVVPSVNQVEIHPLLTQKPLIKFCKSLGIQLEAYSPLARMDPKLINNEYLVKLSKKYDKTVVQVILRWSYQCGVVSIPKTQNKERLKENINIFDFQLTDEEIVNIDNLNCDYRVRHNPDDCDFAKL